MLRITLAGLLLLLIMLPARADDALIASPHLKFSFDRASNVGSLSTNDGKVLLSGVSPLVPIAPNPSLPTSDRLTCAEPEYDSSAAPLVGKRMTLRLIDSSKALNLEFHVTLLDDRAGAVFETVIANVSDRDSIIPHAEAFCGVVQPPNPVTKALTNGYIYYDPGKLIDFTPDKARKIDSFWNAAFYMPESRSTIVAGFLENRDAEGHILAATTNSDAIAIVAQGNFVSDFVLKPGRSISTGRVLVLLSETPFDGLEFYAGASGKLHGFKPKKPINGWCSWFAYYGGGLQEDGIVTHAKVIADRLYVYGMDTVQLDDGYYRAAGDWEGNGNFSHGMKWLATEIRKQGLVPGLWIAPYCIGKNTDVARNHPEWLVHKPGGVLQLIEPAHQAQAQYILDVTHPEARKWLHDLFHTITHDWGYDFIKTDFVEWTILAAQRYHDAGATKAQAYRLGAQTMRDAMGPDRHLLDCGPGPEVVGLIDSMRIELDRPPEAGPLWNQYIGHYNSTAPAVARRYYFHNRTWINDADHLRLAGLSIPQAQCAATITALSGGNMISSDRLDQLDDERMEILKKVLPAFPQGARPLDLFERAEPEIFAMKIENGADPYWVLALFNWSASKKAREFQLASLGLDSDKQYLLHEFWTQDFSTAKGTIRLTQPPTTVSLLAIHPLLDHPQVIGTDRHVTQGAVELSQVRWDPSAKTLSGRAVGAQGMKWTLSVHVPTGLTPSDNPTNLVDVKLDGPVLRARPVFGKSSPVSWSIQFR